MNYKILIVEDDVNFRYALKETIPWGQNGYEIIGEAIHGKQALNMLKKEQVDIVLTDMSMALMNGVELTKEISKLYPDIIVVALSAYDDFEFVKESLKCGAKDYILKQDMQDNEIIRILRELCVKREKEHAGLDDKNILKSQLKHFVLDKKTLTEEIKQKLTKQLAGRSFCALKVIVENRSSNMLIPPILSEEKILYKTEEIPEGFLFFPILSKGISTLGLMNEIKELVSNLHMSISEDHLIGISNSAYTIDQLPELYDQAENALFYHCYNENKSIFYYFEIGQERYTREKEYIYPIEENCKLETPEAAEELLEQVCKMLYIKMPDMIVLNKNFMNIYLNFLHNAIGQYDEWDSLSYYEEIKNMKTLRKKKEYSIHKFYDIWKQKIISYKGKSQEILKAITYINKHYAEDISLTMISQYVGLSDNYFSNLFKAELEQNLTRYINEIRIRKARYLMETTNMKVYEVAIAVGYKNATYFSTMFKKITNMSVTEYKKNDNL